MLRNIFTVPFKCTLRGGSSLLLTTHEQLSVISSIVSRAIGTTTPCASQSKHMRFNRDRDVVRQTDPSYEGANLQKAQVDLQPFGWFPTLETHNQVFYGIRYLDIPIVHIKCTRNNTILTLNEAQTGHTLIMQSAGTVGFRNAKKGTNVAAQAAAVALAGDALRKDIKTVRVCLRGLGPGRQPALKTLELSGLNVVSITDTTRLCFYAFRPKKVRRL